MSKQHLWRNKANGRLYYRYHDYAPRYTGSWDYVVDYVTREHHKLSTYSKLWAEKNFVPAYELFHTP